MRKLYQLFLISVLSWSPAFAQAGGDYLLCNGCTVPAMKSAAESHGAGQHLVIDVTGRKGRIVTVGCGPLQSRSGDPKEEVDQSSTTTSQWSCFAEDATWTAEDQSALDLIVDAIKPDGSISKEMTVQKPNDSIYDFASNPDASFLSVRQTLWGNILTYSPGSTGWMTFTTWGTNFFGLASNAEILVTIIFSDGKIQAKIDMSWAAQNFSEPSLAHVQILYDTAIDNDGNPIPNLSMPSQINPPGVTFHFYGGSPSEQWQQLMNNLGYGFASQASGSLWRCGCGEAAGGQSCSCRRVY